MYISGDNLSLVVTSTEALPPTTKVNVAISGLEDRFGNKIAAKVWSFTTGAGPDFTAPTLLASNLPSTGNQTTEISANTPAVFQFDRPLDPVVSTAQPNSLTPQTEVKFSLSSDLRTLTITPLPAWALGQQYTLYLPSTQDLAGNSLNGGANFTFSVAFDADRTAPRLLAVSPAGQTGMPLNANIIATFDKPVANNSFGHIRLMQGGTQVPLIAMPDELRRARLAPVIQLLPKTTYTVIVQGVADLSGNVMAGTTTHTFTTGTVMDDIAPTGVVYTGDYQAVATEHPNPHSLQRARQPRHSGFQLDLAQQSVNDRFVLLLDYNSVDSGAFVRWDDRYVEAARCADTGLALPSCNHFCTRLCRQLGHYHGWDWQSRAQFLRRLRPRHNSAGSDHRSYQRQHWSACEHADWRGLLEDTVAANHFLHL